MRSWYPCRETVMINVVSILNMRRLRCNLNRRYLSGSAIFLHTRSWSCQPILPLARQLALSISLSLKTWEFLTKDVVHQEDAFRTTSTATDDLPKGFLFIVAHKAENFASSKSMRYSNRRRDKQCQAYLNTWLPKSISAYRKLNLGDLQAFVLMTTAFSWQSNIASFPTPHAQSQSSDLWSFRHLTG